LEFYSDLLHLAKQLQNMNGFFRQFLVFWQKTKDVFQKAGKSTDSVATAWIAGLCASCLLLLFSYDIRDAFLQINAPNAPMSETISDREELSKETRNEKRSVTQLKAKLARAAPTGTYLIINTSKNKFYLKRGTRLLHSGDCSTGSYTVLHTRNKKEKWIFETPRGWFRVRQKIVDPVWRMPDWAFIEEGLAVPGNQDADRFERGVLGDYALDIGNGYLIHGTLYQRLLGLPVTHGCVRLGDRDLEIIYNAMYINSWVFIY
jgi:L,D-transpeptidase ErfK/SrfK